MNKKLIIILGPTAVGKTDYSIETALKYDSPIISCDSRQIYKEMSIGTAVPSAEQLAAVQHYFIHSHTVTELYTAGKYELEALDLINRLFDEGHETLVMAGGSGFYVDALVNGLDDFPAADLELRNELMARLKEEGVESLRAQLQKLDPESYNVIDIANGQRVVRALEVCLMTGKPFSSFKTNSTICVVESIKEVMLIENTAQYHGVYHVLGGVISPMNGISPNDLEISSLVERVEQGDIKEVILALSPNMEGDTTCFYIYRKLAHLPVAVTTIARGVAVGDDLEYADEITLGRSILNRITYNNK